MKRQIVKNALIALVGGVAVTAASVFAGAVTIPNTFSNGTTADAGEVNANFDALAVEVNDNNGRLSTLESATGTPTTVSVSCTGNTPALANAVAAATGSAPITFEITTNDPCDGFTITRDNVTIKAAATIDPVINYPVGAPAPTSPFDATLSLRGADNIELDTVAINGPSGGSAFYATGNSGIRMIDVFVGGSDNGYGLVLNGGSSLELSDGNEITAGNADTLDDESIALQALGSSIFVAGTGNSISDGTLSGTVTVTGDTIAVLLDHTNVLIFEDSVNGIAINGFMELLTGSNWLGNFGGTPSIHLEVGSTLEAGSEDFSGPSISSLSAFGGASISLDNCTISGGIRVGNNSTVSMQDCTISGTHPDGGNTVFNAGTLQLDNSSVSGGTYHLADRSGIQAFGTGTFNAVVNAYNYSIYALFDSMTTNTADDGSGGCGFNAIHVHNVTCGGNQ